MLARPEWGGCQSCLIGMAVGKRRRHGSWFGGKDHREKPTPMGVGRPAGDLRGKIYIFFLTRPFQITFLWSNSQPSQYLQCSCNFFSFFLLARQDRFLKVEYVANFFVSFAFGKMMTFFMEQFPEPSPDLQFTISHLHL